MKNIYAEKIDNGALIPVNGTCIIPDGYKRYEDDENYSLHESGCAKYKRNVNVVIERTPDELDAEPLYIAWFNRLIDAQLAALDVKRIRPSAELNDDTVSADDKKAAKENLKKLNAQAAELRVRRLKA